jgi:hypothetical protein
MAVSKRTRYEVLRRDNHTCRYCGAAAPRTPITIDHVTPVSLGGSDQPDNLVAACRDCNYGKASSSPDAPLVADVKQADMKWARAMIRVARARSRQRKKAERYVDEFCVTWDRWKTGYGDRLPLPGNWHTSILRFYEVGLPIEDVKHCVDIAGGNSRIPPDDTFRYFAGCAWRMVTEMQEAAKELLAAEED